MCERIGSKEADKYTVCTQSNSKEKISLWKAADVFRIVRLKTADNKCMTANTDFINEEDGSIPLETMNCSDNNENQLFMLNVDHGDGDASGLHSGTIGFAADDDLERYTRTETPYKNYKPYFFY